MSDSIFNTFLDYFPEITFPCTLNEDQVQEIGKGEQRLPVDFVRKFICEVPGSSLLGEGSPEISESEGIYILDAFIPFGKFKSKLFAGVLYCLAYEGESEMGLASYSEEGELISRIHFAGSDSSTFTLKGQVYAQGTEIKLTQTDYEYGSKGKKGEELATLVRYISVGQHGVFMDNETGKLIGDEF